MVLQNLGKELSSDEINRTLVLSLPIEWRSKVAAIEEVKNIKTITVEELLGPLITHEHTLVKDWKGKEADMKK